MAKHIYDVVVYYATHKEIRVKAETREDAIKAASTRCHSIGIEPTMLSVPFLPHDEAQQ